MAQCISCFKKGDGLTDAVLWQHIDVRTLFQFHCKKAENVTCFKETAVMNPLRSAGKQPRVVRCRPPYCHERFSVFIYSHSCDYIFRDLMLKFTWESICLPVKDCYAWQFIHVKFNTLFPDCLWHTGGNTKLLGKNAVAIAFLHGHFYISRCGLRCSGLSNLSCPPRRCYWPAGVS